jgi:hypothetical protein
MTLMEIQFKNEIDSKINALQQSKRKNYLLSFGFFILLVWWPVDIPGIYIFAIAVPMVFFFAAFMAFLTEAIEDQKELKALGK